MPSCGVVTKVKKPKVTFKTTLGEERLRTAAGDQWRKKKKQQKKRKTGGDEKNDRAKIDEAMRLVYRCLLDPDETRLEEAVNESNELLGLTPRNEEQEKVAENAGGFVSQFRSFFLMFKVDPALIGDEPDDDECPGRTAREILDEFRRKYEGKTMEDACQGKNGKKNPRRFNALEGFALNGLTKSYLGLWRRVGGSGDDTTSGEDTHCNRAAIRKILRLIPAVGEIVANHVDREGILTMPSEETGPPHEATAAAPSPPTAASIQASEGKQEKPEASDINKKRKYDGDKGITPPPSPPANNP